jgi:hypothetical protein
MNKTLLLTCFLLAACSNNKSPEEKIIPKEIVKPVIIEKKAEIKKSPPKDANKVKNEKFKFEEEDLNLLDLQKEKVFIGIILDEKTQTSPLMEGAHLAINDLYKERGIEVEITRLDIGSKLEDLEINLRPLESKAFRFLLTDLEEEKITLLEPFLNKIKIINLQSCKIELAEVLKVVSAKEPNFHLLLPEGVKAPDQKGVTVIFYSRETNKAKKDFKEIVANLQDNKPIVFTEVTWKSQNLIAELEAQKKNNPIIIAPFASNKLLSDLEIKHKLGKVALVKVKNLDNQFIKNYSLSLKKRPEILAWFSYDLVKNFDQENHFCKTNLSLIGLE